MSKRFGRNQRRRAREALAIEVGKVARASMFAQQATKLADQHHEMYRNASAELDSLRGFFAIVADRVGRESVLVGGEEEAILDDPMVKTFHMVVRSEVPSIPCSTDGREVAFVKSEIMRRLEIDAVREVFQRQTVVRCYLHNSAVGIALSDTFLARSTEYEISHRIAQELAQRLAHEIKRAKS